MIASIASAIVMAALPIAQSGHVLKHERSFGRAKYSVRSGILSHYAGGRESAGTLLGTLDAVYEITRREEAGRWFLEGRCGSALMTRDGKSVPERELNLSRFGVWVAGLDGTTAYKWNDAAREPSGLNSPFWPVAWMPLETEDRLRLGDLIERQFVVSIRSILPDEPLEGEPVTLQYVLDDVGSHGGHQVFGFKISAQHAVDRPARHPEDSELQLEGTISVTGHIYLRRKDALLISGNVTLECALSLTADEYAFDTFASGRLSSTTTYRLLVE